jgi:hypothetical protein
MEYYISIVAIIRKHIPTADIHVFSEGERRHFEQFARAGCSLHLGSATDLAWAHMIQAQLFVMAPSAFSMAPALYAKGLVLFVSDPDDGHYIRPLRHWLSKEDLPAILEQITSCSKTHDMHFGA